MGNAFAIPKEVVFTSIGAPMTKKKFISVRVHLFGIVGDKIEL